MMLRRRLENCLNFFVFTFSIVIHCEFFLVTNVLIVSRFGQKRLLNVIKGNVLYKDIVSTFKCCVLLLTQAVWMYVIRAGVSACAAPMGSISSMEVNVDVLEQMDLMDISDQEALDVFLNSGSGADEGALASPLPGDDCVWAKIDLQPLYYTFSYSHYQLSSPFYNFTLAGHFTKNTPKTQKVSIYYFMSVCRRNLFVNDTVWWIFFFNLGCTITPSCHWYQPIKS